MSDLTVIFLTVNRVPEGWARYQRGVLLDAIGGANVITVSRKPLDWGLNIIQDEIPSAPNIYRQMLRAAKIAKTKFVAIAEDDTLYSGEHFMARPKRAPFLYNMSRWGVLSWADSPAYFYRHRESNSALIADRKKLIEALEERTKDSEYFGEVGKKKVEDKFEKKYDCERFHSITPIINFHHVFAIDEFERLKKKSEAKSLIAYDVPKWGKAVEIVKKFK